MNPKEYWEKKSRPWERSRYSLLGIVLPTSWSLRARLSIAKNWIEDRVRSQPGASVADLGCGSGLLAKRIDKQLHFFYAGIDFSEAAIRAAKQRKLPSKFRFTLTSLERALPFQADFCLALGLTDWLDSRTLERLFAETRSHDLLISYTSSKKRASFKVYSLYRKFYDSEKPSARSFSDDEFFRIYSRYGWHLHQDLSHFLTAPGKILWLRNTSSPST